MAISNDVRGSVRIPRIYVDLVQYAKAIGYVQQYNLTRLTGNDANAVWDFNPANIKQYVYDSDISDVNCGFDVTFKNSTQANDSFGYLLSTINYYGILGHKLKYDLDGLVDTTRVIARDSSGSSYSQAFQNSIVGDPNDCEHIGYGLYGLTSNFVSGTPLNKLRVNFMTDNSTSMNNGSIVDIGALTIGRYFDFPHSANLSMNIKYDADGVKRKRTIGGSDLTDIGYTKPSWGDLAAWGHIDTNNYDSLSEALEKENYSQVSYQGRRSWDLTFSFLSKDDTFTKNMNNNMSGNYDGSTPTWDEDDTIIGNFATYTMNGQIPFIFQPDNTKQDFVIAKLKSNSLSIQQSAPNLYTAKMSFVEVW